MYNIDLPTRAELPSTGKLLRSTFVAALAAVTLLVVAVLPAEYGIDPTGAGRILGLARMGEIKMSLAAEATAAERAVPPPAGTTAPTPMPATPLAAAKPTPVSQGSNALPTQQHAISLTLKPGQAAEIKLGMRKEGRVNYEWTTAGGGVNYDTHGDPIGAPKNFYHGYGKGKNANGDAGMLQAAFDGKHGWFWRNRSATEVTVKLKTNGAYDTIERVL